MAGNESTSSLHRVLVDRCENLEESQARLSEQLNDLIEYKKKTASSNSSRGLITGVFNDGNPYRSVLDSIGHAVHVCSASSGEILCWNRSAENLYGWRDCEILGENEDIIIDEEYYTYLKGIMEMLTSGKSWSGQFPFKKRSGENFMAMVTKSPFYEAGELVGIITVSSDAKVLNSLNSENTRLNKDHSRPQGVRFKMERCYPHPQAAKLLAKLHIRKVVEVENVQQHDGNDASESNQDTIKLPSEGPSKDCTECCCSPRAGYLLQRINIQQHANEPEQGLEVKNGAQSILEDSIGSHQSSLSRGDSEPANSLIHCGIHWQDLQLGEEIGQGSYAAVYHGIWNGSDVAIKVFFGHEYNEGTVQDYKKEIDIMRSLRHPNVLLFMGAVYSPQRLAIVTEFLSRGSLFKTLHKNNHGLDMRRRLRMAIDVARGMNYLHHRNPPIIHRDLKSSNLLVDKSWNVKVGDFGLSRWKDTTLLTTKSGKGTPQWMAPEVLRNEPSNEKCDVFSFGVILWELMTVKIPWSNLNTLEVVAVVGFMNRRLDISKGLEPHVASIISNCWKSDPESRPSFEDIIQEMSILLKDYPAGSTQRN